ncbi:MAG TPA: hypothetical protein VE912_09265 [Bacteroidales bacterium]|nr:hypothetical protein [Bacteroidales bacterium]
MKRLNFIVFLAVFLFKALYSFSQDFSSLNSISLKTEIEYKEAEEQVIECAEYILNTPFDEENKNFAEAGRFLLRWMGGTPDYTFNIDEQAARLIKGNELFLSVYLAGMTKFALENPDNAGDHQKMKEYAVKSLLEYCEKPVNRIKPKGELKKLIKANQKGKLDEYL